MSTEEIVRQHIELLRNNKVTSTDNIHRAEDAPEILLVELPSTVICTFINIALARDFAGAYAKWLQRKKDTLNQSTLAKISSAQLEDLKFFGGNIDDTELKFVATRGGKHVARFAYEDHAELLKEVLADIEIHQVTLVPPSPASGRGPRW